MGMHDLEIFNRFSQLLDESLSTSYFMREPDYRLFWQCLEDRRLARQSTAPGELRPLILWPRDHVLFGRVAINNSQTLPGMLNARWR